MRQDVHGQGGGLVRWDKAVRIWAESGYGNKLFDEVVLELTFDVAEHRWVGPLVEGRDMGTEGAPPRHVDAPEELTRAVLERVFLRS